MCATVSSLALAALSGPICVEHQQDVWLSVLSGSLSTQPPPQYRTELSRHWSAHSQALPCKAQETDAGDDNSCSAGLFLTNGPVTLPID